MDSRGSEHGMWSRRSLAPTPAGPGQLSSQSREAAASHTFPSSGAESFPKKVLEALGKSQRLKKGADRPPTQGPLLCSKRR